MDNDNQDTFSTPFVFKTDWKNAFEDEEFIKVFSSDILENYIINKRWYGGKASTLKYIEIVENFAISSEKNNYFGVLLEVNFKEAFTNIILCRWRLLQKKKLKVAPLLLR